MFNQRLDRTAFKAHTAAEAAKHAAFYRNQTWQDRLEITAYLNSVAFNYPINDPPHIDKTFFKARSRNSG